MTERPPHARRVPARFAARLAHAFEGIWTVPLALTLAGVVLALSVGHIAALSGIGPWIDPEGGRAALSAVAGGVMSVVSIIFSLTFVALSIAAQQLSPRILDFVLRERITQVLAGLALATFLFAAISLALSPADRPERLGVSVPLALVLATTTLAAVVLFVHAMSRVMRSEEMVARLGRGFSAAIGRLLDGPPGCVPVPLSGAAHAVLDAELGADLGADLGSATLVPAPEPGHVSRIDYAGLARLAAAHDLVIAVDVRENDHLLAGMPLARVLGLHQDGAAALADIAGLFALGDRRMPAWGAGYEAATLSDAALRALSPGINDPGTALACLSQLGEGLAILAADGPPPTVFGDARRVARLVLPDRGVADFLEAALLPVAVAGQHDYRLRAIEGFALRIADRSDPVFAD